MPSKTLKHKPIFFFTNRTYFVFGFVVAWIVLTALLPSLFFYVGLIGLAIIAALILLDYTRLKSENKEVIAERKIPKIVLCLSIAFFCRSG